MMTFKTKTSPERVDDSLRYVGLMQRVIPGIRTPRNSNLDYGLGFNMKWDSPVHFEGYNTV
jgi:hypothetical protein